MADDKLEMKYLSVTDLEPNIWNPQTMGAPEMDRLKKEISEVGFIAPIQVVPLDTGKYRIIGGEHRWLAAKELGMIEIPCGIMLGAKWKDEDLQKFVTVRLNVISGRLDPERFAMLYQEMADKYGAESLQNLMGFTDTKAFAKILGGVQKNLKKVLPKEMHGAIDAAAKEAKTVADLGNIIQTLFQKYGDTVNLSFMIFSYGKQNHVYVSMDKAMKKAMDKVIEFCRETGSDINSILAPLTQEWAKEATKQLESKPVKEQEKPLNDVEF
jgi:hypothetical protein